MNTHHLFTFLILSKKKIKEKKRLDYLFKEFSDIIEKRIGTEYGIGFSWRIDFRYKGETSDIKKEIWSLTANAGRHVAIW